MRDPTRKEMREILGKIADDQPHSTGDLFPTLKGDELIQPSEIVIRLGELGFLTYRDAIRTGYDQIPRGVVVIKIAPEGHHWLERDRQIQELAARLFMQKAGPINKEYESSKEAVPRQAAARGNIAGVFKGWADAAYKRISGLAGAQIESHVEAFKTAQVAFDQSVAEELVQKIQTSCKSGKDALLSTFDDFAKRANLSSVSDSVKAEATREISRIEADFKNRVAVKLAEALLQGSNVEGSSQGPFQQWAGSEKPTLAIVFTDIVGSTEMNKKLGNDEMEQIRGSHFNHAGELARQNSGYAVKNTGDGIIAAFRNAAAALDFSLAIRQNPGDERIRIRVAFQVGPVTISNEDVFGNAVNFAARTVAHVKESEIWLSDRAKSDVDEQKLTSHKMLNWEAHQDQELKEFGKQRLWSVTY